MHGSWITGKHVSPTSGGEISHNIREWIASQQKNLNQSRVLPSKLLHNRLLYVRTFPPLRCTPQSNAIVKHGQPTRCKQPENFCVDLSAHTILTLGHHAVHTLRGNVRFYSSLGIPGMFRVVYPGERLIFFRIFP